MNRRTAPALYKKVRGVFRTAEGGLSFSRNGAALDWVVVMRRFDQDLLLDRLAKAGGLSPAMMDQLADHIAAFHAKAERRLDCGGAVEMAELAEAQYRCLAAAQDAGFALAQVEGLIQNGVNGSTQWLD